MEPRDNVVINEVLSHTDPPQSDSIELLNTSATQVGIAGWYLALQPDPRQSRAQ